MVQTPAPAISLTQFLQLPETKPASEYIDAQILQKPMPQGEHSTLQRCLTQYLDERLSPNKIAHAYPEL
jgi:Uma2 family endonuclease